MEQEEDCVYISSFFLFLVCYYQGAAPCFSDMLQIVVWLAYFSNSHFLDIVCFFSFMKPIMNEIAEFDSQYTTQSLSWIESKRCRIHPEELCSESGLLSLVLGKRWNTVPPLSQTKPNQNCRIISSNPRVAGHS